MSDIFVPWVDVHRAYHHDRPCPDYYTERQREIWEEQDRWHPECPFCPVDEWDLMFSRIAGAA